MNAIKITDMEYNNYTFVYHSEQVEALGGFDNVYGLNDNGGDPDGDMWLVVDFCPEIEYQNNAQVKEAVRLGAELIQVREADYDATAWLECADQFSTGENWSGVGSDGKAWFVDRKDAELCQKAHDLFSDDDDLETLAYRINS